jgi:hypothetical protein
MKPKNKKSLDRKFMGEFNCGIFKNEFILGVNCEYDDFLKYAKETYCSEEFINYIKEIKEDYKKYTDTSNGFVNFDYKKGYGILNLKKFEDSWEFYEIMLHEICHIVDFISEQKHLEKEMEARAYLTEYLFKDIRKKIQKFYL